MSENPRQVRAAARKKLLPSSGVLLVIPGVVYLTESFEELQPLYQPIVIGAAFLYAPFLTHLSELITGVPFTQLSKRWDGLRGWQRGVIGLTGCGVLITLIILMMAAILALVTP